MRANHRMYSLPYNGTNPEWFLQEVEKRKKNIDHVYCELPLTESNMFSHVRFLFDGKKNTGSKQKANPDPEKTNLKRANYVKNCAEFLRISKGRVRRICPGKTSSSLWPGRPTITSWRVLFFRITVWPFCCMPYCRNWKSTLPATPINGICGRWKSGGKSAA